MIPPIKAASSSLVSPVTHFKVFLSPRNLGGYLDRNGFGTEILGLIDKPFNACSATAIYWLIYEGGDKNSFAIAVNQIGIRGGNLTVIIGINGKGADFWCNVVLAHPLLKLCKNVSLYSFLSDSANFEEANSQFSYTKSEQFVLDTSPFKSIRLSSNTKRNIAKATKICKIAVLPTKLAISKYIEMVNYSDERRKLLGIKNAKHQHESVKEALNTSYFRLYFACCGEAVASAVFVGIIYDRAYYIMGGTSPEGMNIGAAPFLLFRVAEQLEKEGVKSLTLGLANRESLKSFKYGLGAQSLSMQKAELNQRVPLSSYAFHLLLKSFLASYRLLYRLASLMPRISKKSC